MVSNEQIYEKLLKVESVLNDLKREEDLMISDAEKIEMDEKKLLEILSSDLNKKFQNILDWKKYVWDSCEYRKSSGNDKIIDFECAKTGKPCRFSDCPRNIVS